MNHVSKLVLSILFIGKNIYSDESFKKPLLMKINDQIGQSQTLVVFNYYIKKVIDKTQAKISSDKNNELYQASSMFQELKNEAQETLQIPQEYRLPLKKTNANVAGMASVESLYVNEKNVNPWPYGYKRCVMLHEVVHEKYHDITMGFIVGGSSVCLSTFIYNKLAHSLSKKAQFMCFILSSLSSVFAIRFHHHHAEGRADIEACYASQCYLCVKEFSWSKEVSYNVMKGGYLTRSQVEQISEELQQQNKLCAFHKKQH